MKKHSFGLMLITLLSGCSTHLTPLDSPITIFDIKAQMFTYTELSDNQNVLWEKARRHLISTYGKSQPILRVENKVNGTLLGKGLVRWKKSSSSDSYYCYSEYDIRFMTRDHKARLQLTLLPGVPAKSECDDWGLPSQYGYEQIIDKFTVMSDDLGSVLRRTK
ncbi:hypothetical protein ACU5EH_15305 [Aliivibrio salmonicida]|uniref:hypothetical protein n=1 Tax=Aliivibrio salmonicida TaxID=40269 RepID=UPI00406C0E59